MMGMLFWVLVGIPWSCVLVAAERMSAGRAIGLMVSAGRVWCRLLRAILWAGSVPFTASMVSPDRLYVRCCLPALSTT